MSIITREKLTARISDHGLYPLEVAALNISNQIHLNLDNIETFLEFASDSNSKYIYYYYTYYDKEEYIIPSDWYDEYSKDFIDEVGQYNQYIEALNFNTPKGLALFILDSGAFLGITMKDPWIENQNISKADEAIEVIEKKFYREVKHVTENKKKQQKEDEDELRRIIFNDPEFRHCKNQQLRYYYLADLLENEDMRKYEYLFEPFGAPHIGNAKMFMDTTWRLYKEQSE